MSKPHIQLRRHAGEDRSAYLELAAYPALAQVLQHQTLTPNSPARIARTVDIHGLIENYDGPRLSVDLDADGRPIGLEIIYPYGNDEPDEP